MYKNKYFTESQEIDVTEMLNAIPSKMTLDEKADWIEAFDCLDDETQAELVGVRNIMSERRHTPVADDEFDEENEMSDDYDMTDAEAYFSKKAREFERRKMSLK